MLVTKKRSGAKIRGIYFEGPYFTEKYKGAQKPLTYMKSPRMDEFRAWQKAANGLLNKIALAPEREGVEDFCSYGYGRRCDGCSWALKRDF